MKLKHFASGSVAFLLILTGLVYGQGDPSVSKEPFPAFDQWKSAVLAADADKLKALYSVNPVARIQVGEHELDTAADIHFWTALKARDMKIDILQSGSPQVQPGRNQILFRAQIRSAAGPEEQTLYLTEGQVWQQEDQQWRLVTTKRTEVSRLEQPVSNQKNIYPGDADAHAEIKEALEKASQDHKRVLVVFGANWCYDCHVLDLAFQREDISPMLTANFEVVHVDVGQGEKNQDLMKQYDVPMERGIPALAVLNGAGKLLYSQKNGEFERARALGPDDLLDFLNKWKPVS